MCPIAQRAFVGGFASAKEDLFVCLSGVFHGRQVCVFVRPIAERLVGGQSTGTPKVCFAFGHFDGVRRSLSYFGDFGHVVSYAVFKTNTLARNRISSSAPTGHTHPPHQR